MVDLVVAVILHVEVTLFDLLDKARGTRYLLLPGGYTLVEGVEVVFLDQGVREEFHAV